MKIKLAILEKDQSYLNRIVTAFSTKYADKFELYSFLDKEVAMNMIEEARIDVFIANEAYEIDTEALPSRCGFAYFVDSADIDTVREQRAISKFQKVDLIYKQILSLFSENAGSLSGFKLGDDSAKIIAFSSPSGGTGCSTMAAACAKHFATKGKKTLYLNLESFGSSDAFFKAEGQFNMSDIIFAVKSKKANLSLKLESCVKQDVSGVCFYSQSKIALDMLELTNEDISRLITEIKLAGTYEYIILDTSFAMDKNTLNIFRQAHALVWVGDGTEISNTKIFRAYNALTTLEAKAEAPITNRVSLIYNKFSNKTSKAIDGIELRNIGGAPRYEHATVEQVIQQLAPMEMFEKIIY